MPRLYVLRSKHVRDSRVEGVEKVSPESPGEVWSPGDYQKVCGVFECRFFDSLGPCSQWGRDEAGDRFVVGFFEGSREEKVF
jgi:hypothetical protein